MANSSNLTAEIVTFRAAPDVSVADMTRAAEGIAAFLVGCDGFVARHLSRAEDGTWTDHVIWRSLAQASAAAERLMADPAAAAFMALIDMASVRMVHAPVAVAQMAA